MSANTCIVYFGLRYEVTSGENEGLEERSDSRIVAARTAGLKHYWANFSEENPKYVLFVGAELGVLGPENALEVVRSHAEIQSLFDMTITKLKEAGLEGEASLHIQWEPDV